MQTTHPEEKFLTLLKEWNLSLSLSVARSLARSLAACVGVSEYVCSRFKAEKPLESPEHHLNL